MRKIFNKIIWIIIFVQLIIICTIVRTSKVDDMTLAKGEETSFCTGWTLVRENGEETALGELPFYAESRPYEKVIIKNVIPDEYFGNVMGDLTSRRGKPLGQETQGNAVKLSAMVPLSEMFGYATNLRSNTQGRATFVMFFDHYEEVPKNIAEEIIKKSGN